MYHDVFGTLNGRSLPDRSLLYGCTCNLSIDTTIVNIMFDESFPLASFEDVEFCVRARKHGLHLKYEPKAIVQHFYEASLIGLFRWATLLLLYWYRFLSHRRAKGLTLINVYCIVEIACLPKFAAFRNDEATCDEGEKPSCTHNRQACLRETKSLLWNENVTFFTGNSGNMDSWKVAWQQSTKSILAGYQSVQIYLLVQR